MVAKTRVTPLKSQSIPRLELTAGVISVRLAKKVCDNLQMDIKFVNFWVDAQDVLWWIQKPTKSFKPYISNRVSEIQSLTCGEQWNYCPSGQNPADLPSRGCSVEELIRSKIWWEGPDFVRQERNVGPLNSYPSVACGRMSIQNINLRTEGRTEVRLGVYSERVCKETFIPQS